MHFVGTPLRHAHKVDPINNFMTWGAEGARKVGWTGTASRIDGIAAGYRGLSRVPGQFVLDSIKGTGNSQAAP